MLICLGRNSARTAQQYGLLPQPRGMWQQAIWMNSVSYRFGGAAPRQIPPRALQSTARAEQQYTEARCLALAIGTCRCHVDHDKAMEFDVHAEASMCMHAASKECAGRSPLSRTSSYLQSLPGPVRAIYMCCNVQATVDAVQ